jgi:DNA polymerase elongation subunit (family B)
MYVDAIHDAKKNIIRVAERDADGNRHLTEFDSEYVFYYSHPAGGTRSMYGDSCKKYSTNDGQKFRKELGRFQNDVDKHGKPRYKIFEADINPVFRALEKHYKGVDAPVLNLAFFDIETGFCDKRGFAPVDDPFNPVTAISIHLSHVDRLICLVLRPPTLTDAEAQVIVDQFPDTFLFDDERELLRSFMAVVQDSDVLSGWNSTLFDIPYIVNRIKRIIDEDATRDLCLWRMKPRQRLVPKFGRDHESYDLFGRVHLDYLELYQKHNPQQQQSYRLDFIGEIEVGDNKIPYEGTLDDLYKKDFYKFIEYSRQDVALLVKIDAKKKFIELANQIAHVNCVQLKTTMGSVALVEQAILLEMHEMGLVAPCRRPKAEDEPEPEDAIDLDGLVDDDEDGEEEEFDPKKLKKKPVVGAYVAKPKVGLQSHVAAVDINSLYPSVIRAMNLSPETIVGQIRSDETKALVEERIAKKVPRAEAWDGIFATLEVDHMMAKDGAPLTVDFDDGTTKVFSGRQLYDYVFNPKNKLCVSANGTIFRTDQDGIIPLLLAKWYRERKEMQGKKGFYGKLSKGLAVDPDLAAQIAQHLG